MSVNIASARAVLSLVAVCAGLFGNASALVTARVSASGDVPQPLTTVRDSSSPALVKALRVANWSVLSPFTRPTWLSKDRDLTTSWQASASNAVGEFKWRAWTLAAVVTWVIWLLLVVLVYNLGYSREVPSKYASSKFCDQEEPQRQLESGHFQCAQDPKICLWAFLCPALRWADTVRMMGVLQFPIALSIYAILSLLNYTNFYTVLGAGLVSVIGCAYYTYKWTERTFLVSDNDDEQTSNVKTAMVIIFFTLVIVGLVTLWFECRKVMQGPLQQYMGWYGCFTWGCFTTCAIFYSRQRLREMLNIQRNSFQVLVEDVCFLFWCPCCAIAQEARVVNEMYRVGHEAVKDGPCR